MFILYFVTQITGGKSNNQSNMEEKKYVWISKNYIGIVHRSKNFIYNFLFSNLLLLSSWKKKFLKIPTKSYPKPNNNKKTFSYQVLTKSLIFLLFMLTGCFT